MGGILEIAHPSPPTNSTSTTNPKALQPQTTMTKLLVRCRRFSISDSGRCRRACRIFFPRCSRGRQEKRQTRGATVQITLQVDFYRATPSTLEMNTLARL